MFNDNIFITVLVIISYWHIYKQWILLALRLCSYLLHVVNLSLLDKLKWCLFSWLIKTNSKRVSVRISFLVDPKPTSLEIAPSDLVSSDVCLPISSISNRGIDFKLVCLEIMGTWYWFRSYMLLFKYWPDKWNVFSLQYRSTKTRLTTDFYPFYRHKNSIGTMLLGNNYFPVCVCRQEIVTQHKKMKPFQYN